jgi:hypothetical protein
MASRLQLQTKLEELLGSRNVYYQPPETVKMEYPAIRYSKSDIDSKYANDAKYSNITQYEIIVIDKRPDNNVIQKILDLPLSSFDRHYTANNLNHDVIKLYF